MNFYSHFNWHDPWYSFPNVSDGIKIIRCRNCKQIFKNLIEVPRSEPCKFYKLRIFI